MKLVEKIATPDQGLALLARRYGAALPEDARLTAGNRPSLTARGKTLPLLPWRKERRFTELKNMVNDGTLRDVSSIRSCRIEKAGTDLAALLYRELDLVEWLMDSPLEYLFTVKKGAAANTVARLRCGVVCTLETAATLAPGTEILDKHEIIASKGVALDKVVDTQVGQSSVYLYTGEETPETFTDVDFELYGLEPDQVALVRCGFEALEDPAAAGQMAAQALRLEKLTALALKSAETGRKMMVED